MVLTGVLRHYATILLATPPKPASTPLESRERQSLMRGMNLRNNASASGLSQTAFSTRRDYLVDSYKKGAFLKSGPDSRGQAAPNPMTDPAAMEGMMGMMKGNMAMMIPQTLIMSWINAFFAGFVIRTLLQHSTLSYLLRPSQSSSLSHSQSASSRCCKQAS